MTNKAVIEAPHQSSNPADAQDLLMEADHVIKFIREAVHRAGDADESIFETSGLSYVLGDVQGRLDKANTIIDAYKARREVAHHG